MVAPAQPWLALSDEDYRIAARYRLGLPLREGGGACCNRYTTDAADGRPRVGQACGLPLDANGLHSMVCKVGGRILRRHHGLRDLLAGMLGEAGIFVLREQREPRWDREVPAQGGGTRWEAAVLTFGWRIRRRRLWRSGMSSSRRRTRRRRPEVGRWTMAQRIRRRQARWRGRRSPGRFGYSSANPPRML